MIATTAYEKFGFGARSKKIQIISPIIHRLNWKLQTNYRLHAIIRTRYSQSHRRSKRETRENQWQMIFAIEPIQRGPNILRFSLPMSMLPLTQSESTKVESQHRKSEAVQRFHRMKDDLVMHRSAINRMWMANQSSIIRIVCARVEQGFEPARRAVDEQ